MNQNHSIDHGYESNIRFIRNDARCLVYYYYYLRYEQLLKYAHRWGAMSQSDTEQNALSMFNSLNSMEKLMLYTAGSLDRDLRSKVKMQKVLFLVSEAIPAAFGDGLHFEAHKKGPYSQTVDDYLNAFEDSGLMVLPSCTLTDSGKDVVRLATPRQPLKGIVDDVKDMVISMSEDELLLMICVDYPEYRRNSEEWGRMCSERRNLADRMLSKHIISAARAAELAGVPENEYLNDLYERGIRWRDAL